MQPRSSNSEMASQTKTSRHLADDRLSIEKGKGVSLNGILYPFCMMSKTNSVAPIVSRQKGKHARSFPHKNSEQ